MKQEKSEYAFRVVDFGRPRQVAEPVAAAVRKCQPRAVVIRLSGEVARKCKFAPGDILTPFVDEDNRAVLLLSGMRPQPDSGRKLVGKNGKGAALEIPFPRCGGMEELFPVRGMTGMELREASAGRLVFTVPRGGSC